MSTPSLLIVPARLKAGTLFSQIPTNGNGDFTVVQVSGNATRVNASGLIERANTNLAFNSGNWLSTIGSEWASERVSISSGSTSDFIGPFGGLVANAVRPTASSGTHLFYSNVSTNIAYTSGTIYTMSGFFKAGSGAAGTRIQLTFNSSQFNQLGYANFDLNLGTVTATGGTADPARRADIQAVGNGWYRCSITATCSLSGSGVGFLAYLITSDSALRNPSFNGVTTDAVYGWGAQVEANGFAGAYVPTTTGSATSFCGVVQSGTTSTNIPRLDYYTSSGTPGCPALLVEPSATNLAFHSHLWVTGNNWANTEITVVTGTTATTDPFGTNFANAISPISGNTLHIAQSNTPTAIAFTSGTIYTQSAFFKQGTGVAGRYAQLTFPSAAFSQLGYANFDLQLGTLAVVSGTSADTNRAASIENFGNGWYRCRLTGTCTSSTSAAGVGFVLATTSGAIRAASFSGTVTDVIYGVGAQLETGSVATSYIPTTTGTGSRSADVISVSGAVSGSIGQTEGTIYAEVDVRQLVGSVAKTFIDIGVLSNRIFLGFTSIASNTIRLQIDSSEGLTRVDIRAAVSSSGIIKIAAAYKSSNCALYVNGASGTVTENQTFTLSTLSNISLGKTLSDTAFFNDRIRAVALYTTRLSNADLTLLTMPGNDTYLPQAVWNNYLSRPGNAEVPDCLYTRHADLLDV